MNEFGETPATNRMSVYFIDKNNPDSGRYEITQRPDGEWTWTWTEVAKGIQYKDDGPSFASRSLALLHAADDWEQNGDSSNRRFAGMLRGLARREEIA